MQTEQDVLIVKVMVGMLTMLLNVMAGLVKFAHVKEYKLNARSVVEQDYLTQPGKKERDDETCKLLGYGA